MRLFAFFGVLVVLGLSQASAGGVNITSDMPVRTIVLNGQTINIQRIQDPEHRLDSEFSKTSRQCPPFCIHPIQIAPGVKTLGELEVMDFLEFRVATHQGLLVDSRVPSWFSKGTIPGAVNIPFTILDKSNSLRGEILLALGARKNGDVWDFTNAKELALFCNGPWCDQSPRSIADLLEMGYPPEKLFYYRGGMQLWNIFSLTVLLP